MKYILTILGVIILVASGYVLLPREKNVSMGAGELSNEESLFAEIAPDGTVLRVIVISQETLNTGYWGDPTNWVRTSNKGTIRKNYAGKGYVYDKTRDAFIPPKQEGETIFDETKARWEIPEVINISNDSFATSTEI